MSYFDDFIGARPEMSGALRRAVAQRSSYYSNPDGVVVPPLTATYGTRSALYPHPNGGNRVLPSVYTTLRTRWLSAIGEFLDPKMMVSGRIRNCLSLLKESHGNAQARAQSHLGKITLHYRHSPEVCAVMEQACLLMQKIDVDDMYPIYKVLATELSSREDRQGERDRWSVASDMGDTLSLW